jgi:2C-methyl-D-erythritol 2,4-cyclodiphosphate synthase
VSAAVGAPVTLAGRRAEGLGALGRIEGVACFATALMESARVTAQLLDHPETV